MNKHERFLGACQSKPVDRPPLWIMRQAGRYLPEYLELRKQHDFAELIHRPELAARVTAMPIRRFEFDAAIVFSDILVVPEALGVKITYGDGGPDLSPLVGSRQALAGLRGGAGEDDFSFVAQAIKLFIEQDQNRTPIIGFAGGPFTLAAYMVGGRDAERAGLIKKLWYREPETATALMELLVPAIAAKLRAQLKAGAAAVQIFDTWAGRLSPADFERFALPWIRKVFGLLGDVEAPRILFINGVGGVAEAAAQSGATVLGVDWRIELTQVRQRIGGQIALQGNLDPLVLFAKPEFIEAEALRIGRQLGGRGHIFNLGHGIMPDTPLAGVETLVAAVRRLETP